MCLFVSPCLSLCISSAGQEEGERLLAAVLGTRRPGCATGSGLTCGCHLLSGSIVGAIGIRFLLLTPTRVLFAKGARSSQGPGVISWNLLPLCR